MKFRIGLKRLEEAGRSFTELARGSLCPNCREGAYGNAEEIMARVRECCAQAPGFLDPGLPLKSLIFRLLLLRGNQPLTLEELAEEIKKVRDLAPSPEALERVLRADRFYGFEAVDSAD